MNREWRYLSGFHIDVEWWRILSLLKTETNAQRCFPRNLVLETVFSGSICCLKMGTYCPTDILNSFIIRPREVSIAEIVLVGSGQWGRLGELLAYLDKIQHILKERMLHWSLLTGTNPLLFLQISFAVGCSAAASPCNACIHTKTLL